MQMGTLTVVVGAALMVVYHLFANVLRWWKGWSVGCNAMQCYEVRCLGLS